MATMLNPNAIPDGSITQEKIESSVLAGKQDKLTAGNGINIEDKKIGVTAITESESQPSTPLWVNPSEDAETNITYNRSQIDALVGAKQDTLQLTVKDNGNIVLSNIQGQSKEFMPATPSGDPMHYAYVAAGAEYNDTGVDIVKTTPWADLADDDADKTVVHKAGYWYLNGLGDISNYELSLIYANRIPLSGSQYLNEIKRGYPYRTVLNQSRTADAAHNESRAFYASKCLTIKVGNTDYTIIYDYRSWIQNSNVISVIGIVDERFNSSIKDSEGTYICLNLKHIKIKSMKFSHSFSVCVNLTNKSILYMIENEAATSAITITLHADAYARAMANADIVAALEAHPNVSLASA